MADFKVEGLDVAQAQLRQIARAPDEVKGDILRSMADVAAAEQKKTGMEFGIYDADSGGKHLVDTIKVNKPKLSEDGGTISVTFSGKRKDKKHKTPVRNAEIAFINEYGKRGQAARPFVRTANTRAEERIQKAGQAVWDEWTKTHLKGEN